MKSLVVIRGFMTSARPRRVVTNSGNPDGALGPALSSSYLAIRRADWQLFSGRDTTFELKHHFYKY